MRPLFLLVVCAPLSAQTPPSPPAGFEQVDFDIKLGVLPAQLRFDVEQFAVDPGSKVKLTLSNTDAMQHNFVLCDGGKDVADEVAAAALRLGAAASERHFVPDMKAVLASTKALFLDQQDTIWFRAPQQPGEYVYVCTLPGHSFTMKGTMRVGLGAPPAQTGPIDNLRYRLFRGAWEQLPDFSQLTPFREGELDGGIVQLAALKETHDFGAVFTGSIEAKVAGRHTFYLKSDDGSRLLVDDREIVLYDGLHEPGKEQEGVVELTAGAHQLRIEYFQRAFDQALRVAFAGPDSPRVALSGELILPDKVVPIAVHHHHPVVMRVHVEGAASRTIAVGLPGGMNYCFDAARCSVQFGWAGAFLDVGPDRNARGGQPCRTLGPRFAVGDVGFPLRTATGAERPVRFRGYRTGHLPAFDLDWDGVAVSWAIAPAAEGIGLDYTFAFATPTTESMRFVIDADGLQLSSTLGAVEGGTLVVPANTRTFSVQVQSKEELR
ncbi:MAG: PA14 domain-containing protein [Planctomycetota bacterium]